MARAARAAEPPRSERTPMAPNGEPSAYVSRTFLASSVILVARHRARAGSADG